MAEVSQTARKAAPRHDQLLIAVIAGALLFYTGWRAINLCFTHDESVTALDYVTLPFRDIIQQVTVTANNHLLNTLLMRFSAMHAGFDVFPLRLPNVLAHALYLLSAALVAMRLKTRTARICGFILLTLNVFMLDFFSLARGYGLSLAFEMLSLFFVLRIAEGSRSYFFRIGIPLAGALAVLANFAMVTVFLAECGVLALLLARQEMLANEDKPRSKILRTGFAYLPTLAIGGLLLWWLMPVLRALEQKHELYFGANSPIESALSIIGASLYMDNPPKLLTMPILCLVCAALIFACWVAARLAMARKFAVSVRVGAPLAIFIAAAIGAILEHALFGTLYPISRTALPWIPPFMMAFIVAADEFAPGVMSAWKAAMPLMAAAFIALLVALPALNLSWFLSFRDEADTARMLNDLAALRQQSPPTDRQLRLGAFWGYEPQINFYRAIHGLNWLTRATRNGLRGDYDVWFLRPEDAKEAMSLGLKVIKRYPDTGNMLAVRSEPMSTETK